MSSARARRCCHARRAGETRMHASAAGLFELLYMQRCMLAFNPAEGVHHMLPDVPCRTWLYPAMPPPREYQFHIAWTATLHNTLACLPTGLGKTLIAAVVMYNFYRWFPMVRLPGLRATQLC